ncbi:GNAT family N-acetyltransferase [Dysgonomonas sp. ZJ709]|uniref:GNAT family N-acetyltransferase n=1 Tax=Dysgonomonas sp. ZJ709 TaxID=2709797 RepID=UPI0013EDA110|nr:GNAT family N-acetyltransferase [Dysgonomonas sp. ZJ709]
MILPASEKDYPILIDIWASAVSATHDFLSKEDFEYYKSRLPFYFTQVSLFVFRDENSDIKGFLGVLDDNIEMLFVHNCFRGLGIGKKLLTFATENLNLRKVDVNEENKQALEFYTYFGFKQINRSAHDSEGKNYPLIHLIL